MSRFRVGEMGAALGHDHPRYVAAVERSLRTISHSIRSGFEPPARS